MRAEKRTGPVAGPVRSQTVGAGLLVLILVPAPLIDACPVPPAGMLAELSIM